MKKQILLTITALAVVSGGIMTVSSSNSSAKNNPRAIKVKRRPNTLPGEDALNVTPDSIHPPTANADWTLMVNGIFVWKGGTNMTVIDSVSAKVDTAYLRNLYNAAVGKKNGTHYVTALQIKYGIHNGHVKYYFMPLCLTRDSTHTVGNTVYGYYSNHNKFDSAYYCYGSTGFYTAPYKNQFLKDSLYYIDSILFKHRTGQTAKHFYETGNDSNDVHSVIISFQELYALVSNNPNSRYIKACNIGIAYTAYGKTFTRHDVIWGPSDLPPSKTSTVNGSGNYYNNYADLGNLCPPTCGEISYPMQ